MTLHLATVATCDECGARAVGTAPDGWTWSSSRVTPHDRCDACSADTPAHAGEDYEAPHPGRQRDYGYISLGSMPSSAGWPRWPKPDPTRA